MTARFSAWREGARYYAPCFVAAAITGAILWPYGWAPVSIALLLAGIGVLFFFRDPKRVVPQGPREIVAPADGRIVSIEDVRSSPYYRGLSKRITIFLSLLDVHVNRSPTDGQVADLKYQKGQFRHAMTPEAGECNESNTVWMESPHGPVTVRQIAGLVARRIVCKCRVGETLQKGERFGMIRFGSRTELYLPPHVHVCVQVEDKVYAGTTVVARFL